MGTLVRGPTQRPNDHTEHRPDRRGTGRRLVEVITPQVVDRSKFPTADAEYTPRQRRAIDASLAEAEKGPYYGPFQSGAEIAAFMKKRQRREKSAKSKKPR